MGKLMVTIGVFGIGYLIFLASDYNTRFLREGECYQFNWNEQHAFEIVQTRTYGAVIKYFAGTEEIYVNYNELKQIRQIDCWWK